MKIKISKLELEEKLFYTSYCIYLFFSILSATFYFKYFYGLPYKMIKVVVVFVLALVELERCKTNKKSFYGLILLIAAAAIVIYNTNMFSEASILLVFLYCSRNMSFDRIAKNTIKVTCVTLGLVILSSYIGVIPNYISIAGSRRREYLGFRYALYPAALFFNVIALSLYVNRKNQKLWKIGLLIAFDLWIYQKTNSRLSFYLSVLMVVVILIFYKFPKLLNRSKIIHVLTCMSFIIASVVSVCLTVFYNSNVHWMRELNVFLGKRLQYGQQSLLLYGVSLFGKKNVEWIGNGLDIYGKKLSGRYLWVDNFFISSIQRYGVIIGIVVVIVFTLVLIKALREKQYYLMVFLSFIALHCIVDDLFLYLYYNTFWLSIGTVLIGKNNAIKNRSDLHSQKFVSMRR